MKIYNLKDYTKGWFIGDFEPSVLKTKNFEVGFLSHHKGEKWPVHYHKLATEINYLISGRMVIQGKELIAGTVFMIEPNEIADPQFLEDCKVICIKIPSIPGDKYEK